MFKHDTSKTVSEPFKKMILATAFAVSVMVASITAAKLTYFNLPLLGVTAVPAGFIAFSIAYLQTDLLGELYGREVARNVVNATILAIGLGYLLVEASLALPAAPFYKQEAAFQAILGNSSSIVVATLTTMFISQNTDVAIFHAIRDRTGGRLKFARNIGSTAVSQLVDTVLFITLGFVVLPMFLGGTPQSVGVAASLIVGQYIVKLGVALLDTPFFYLFTRSEGYRAEKGPSNVQ